MVEVLQLVGRNIFKFVRQPALIVVSLVMPIVMLGLFGQVFRSIAMTPNFPRGVSYIDYLLPAVLCTTLTQSATSSSTAIATDLSSGVMDRFRSLPIRAWTVLMARNIADLVRGVGQALVMLGLGLVVFGFRFRGSLFESVAAFLVAVPMAFAFNWLFIWIGVVVKNPEVTQVTGLLFTMPLMFASSAYVPVQSLPGWLQLVAKLNPLSFTIDAARAFALGKSPGSAAWQAIGVAVGLAVVCIVGASWSFRRIDG